MLTLPGLCCPDLLAAGVSPAVPWVLCASTALHKLAQAPRKFQVILQLGWVFFPSLSLLFLTRGNEK